MINQLKKMMLATSGAIDDSLQWLLNSLGFGNDIIGNKVTIDKKGNQTRPIQQGRSYLFDGIDDRVSVSVSPNLVLTNNFALTGWVYLDSSFPINSQFVGFGGGLGPNFGFEDTGEPYFFDGVYYIRTNIALATNTWIHLVYVCDNGQLSLYENNVWKQTVAYSGTINTATFQIGSYNLATQFFKGKIYDIRIFTNTLTTEERTQIYNHETTVAMSDLYAQYKADEQSGTIAYDSSGNENHGTITNATLSTFHSTQNEFSFQNEVGYNGALDFDGTNDYVEVPDDENWDFGAENFTVDFWVNPSASPNTYNSLVGQNINGSYTGTSWWVYMGSTRTITFYNSNGSDTIINATSAASIPLNEWTHIAHVRNGSSFKIYINGVEDGSYTYAGPLNNLNNAVQIGADTNGSGNRYFTGKMTNARITKGTLSGTGLTKVIAGQELTDQDDKNKLVAHWKLNQFNTDDKVIDSSGQNNHGTFKPNFATGDRPLWHAIPRKEDATNIALPIAQQTDISDRLLEYNGRTKYNAKLVESNGATFDGTSDYVDLDSHISSIASDTEGTISLRIKLSSTSTALQSLFSASDKSDASSDISITKYDAGSSNRIGFQIRENGTLSLAFKASISGFNDDTWHHILITMNSSGNSLYIDGVLDTPIYTVGNASTQAWFNSINDLDALRIGNNINSSGNRYYTKGQISDVRIFDKTLNQTEITQIYNKEIDVATSDLVAHYPLQEGWGNKIYDVSGQDNHGTATNITEATFWGTTQDVNHYNIEKGFAGALDFDGTGDYVSIPDSADWDFGTDDYSIEGWFYLNNNTSQYDLYGRYSGENKNSFLINYQTSKKLRLYAFNSAGTRADSVGTWTSTNTFEPNTWIHVAVVQDNDVLKLYVNGNVEVNLSPFAQNIDNNIPFYLGTSNGSAGLLNGKINNFRIFKGRALTQPEITTLSSGQEIADPTTDLVGHWKLNDMTGTTAIDSSGQGNNGTLNGDPQWLWIPALLDGTKSASGGLILNPASYWHNNAETKIQNELAPALIQADINDGNDFLFNAGKDTANKIAYSDIVADVGGDGNITADVGTTNQKKDLKVS